MSIERSKTQLQEAVASRTLNAAEVTDRLSLLDRMPCTRNGQRENNVHHSFSLSLACIEVASLLNKSGVTQLDVDKVCRLALAHDFVELVTGDIPTFSISDKELEAKHHNEKAALPALLEELDETMPELAKSLREYEDQDSEEAWFVRTIDKLIPAAVYVTGDGMEALRQSTNITDLEALRLAHAGLRDRLARQDFNRHPEIIMPAYKIIHEKFEKIFQEKTSS